MGVRLHSGDLTQLYIRNLQQGCQNDCDPKSHYTSVAGFSKIYLLKWSIVFDQMVGLNFHCSSWLSSDMQFLYCFIAVLLSIYIQITLMKNIKRPNIKKLQNTFVSEKCMRVCVY